MSNVQCQMGDPCRSRLSQDTVARLALPPHPFINSASRYLWIRRQTPDDVQPSLVMPSQLTVTFVQSTVLNALSNILAQLIDQRNKTVRLAPQCIKTSANHLSGPFYSEHIGTTPVRVIWHPSRADQLLLATRPGGAVSRIPLTGGNLQSVALSVTEVAAFIRMASFILLFHPGHIQR